MLTDSAIESLATAIFDRPNPWVAEAYSAYEQEPLVFSSTEELSRYFGATLARPKEHAFVFVVYPDMIERAAREVIRLKPGAYPDRDPPSTWNWNLVGSHVRRLRRILSKVAPAGVGSRD